MIKRIFLIGMAGSGKTTVGKELAKKLGWLFIDTDQRIEKVLNKKISDIFSEEGSEYFNKVETDALEYAIKLGNETNIVIATGGRTYLNDLNKALMIDSGLIIYLKSDTKTIYKRLNKPVELKKRRFIWGITKSTLKISISSLLGVRKKYYSSCSIEINASRSKKLIVNDIIKLFGVLNE